MDRKSGLILPCCIIWMLFILAPLSLYAQVSNAGIPEAEVSNDENGSSFSGTVEATWSSGYLPEFQSRSTPARSIYALRARAGLTLFNTLPLLLDVDGQEPTGIFGTTNRFSVRLDRRKLGSITSKINDPRAIQADTQLDSLNNLLRKERTLLSFYALRLADEARARSIPRDTLHVRSMSSVAVSDTPTTAPLDIPSDSSEGEAMHLRALAARNRIDELNEQLRSLSNMKRSEERRSVDIGTPSSGIPGFLKLIKCLSIGTFQPLTADPLLSGVPLVGQEIGLGNRKFYFYAARGYARSPLLIDPARGTLLSSIATSFGFPSARDRSSLNYVLRTGVGDPEGDHLHVLALLGHGADPWGGWSPEPAFETRNTVVGLDFQRKLNKGLEVQATLARSRTRLTVVDRVAGFTDNDPSLSAPDPYAGRIAVRFKSGKGNTRLNGEFDYQEDRFRSFLYWGRSRGIKVRFSGSQRISKPWRVAWSVERSQRPDVGMTGERMLGSVSNDIRFSSRSGFRVSWSRSEQRTAMLTDGYHTAGMQQGMVSWNIRKRVGRSDLMALCQLTRTEWSIGDVANDRSSTTLLLNLSGRSDQRFGWELGALSLDQPDTLTSGWERGLRLTAGMRCSWKRLGAWSISGDHMWRSQHWGASVRGRIPVGRKFTITCGYVMKQGVDNFRNSFFDSSEEAVSLVTVGVARSF